MDTEAIRHRTAHNMAALRPLLRDPNVADALLLGVHAELSGLAPPDDAAARARAQVAESRLREAFAKADAAWVAANGGAPVAPASPAQTREPDPAPPAAAADPDEDAVERPKAVPRCPPRQLQRLPPFSEGCRPVLDVVRRDVPELRQHTDQEVAALWEWFSEETAAAPWLELGGADPFVEFLARQQPEDWRHAWGPRP